MLLEKGDLVQIEKIVDKKVSQSEKRLKNYVDVRADQSEKKLEKKIEKSVSGAKNEVITTLSREINNLAEINRAVISQVSQITELEKRVMRIEHKIGIKNY